MYLKILFIAGLLLATSSISFAFDADNTEQIALRKAVEQALANNLNLVLQREDVQIAEGATLSAEGKFDFIFDANTTAQSQEFTPIVLGGAEHEDTGLWGAKLSKLFSTGTSVSLDWSNSYYDSDALGFLMNPSYKTGITLGITQSVLKGFGREIQTSQLRASQKQQQAASFQLDSQAANLAALVKRAYWSLVFAWQDIKVREFSLTLAKKLLKETEDKINAGKLAQVEIYQPQSEVARREEDLISAERAIGAAEDELKLLLNSDKWFITFEPTDKPATEPIKLDLQTILDNALQNRPDVKAADLYTQAAEIVRKSAKDNTRPDLALQGSVGVTGTDENYGDSIDTSLSSPDTPWQVGITFSIPLENSVAKGYYQQAKARYNRAKTSAELLRQQIRQTVRTTIRDVELAIKALDATRKTSFATEKRLEAEQAKFDSGRSTTLDVLIAQDAYSQALSKENLTNIAYANTLGELDRIQGLVTFSSSRPVK
jgi:outer membrane protein